MTNAGISAFADRKAFKGAGGYIRLQTVGKYDTIFAMIDILHGSGNVFADLGDPNAEAKKMKAAIAAEIIATLNARGLSARAGAKVAKVDPADIQRIRNADLSRFTIDRLVRVASHLGCALEMTVLPRSSSILVRYDSLDDLPPAPPVKARSEDEIERHSAAAEAEEDEPLWPTRAERVFSIEQAQLLKEQAREGGLRFDAFLTSELAVWVLEFIEQGVFTSPSEAVWVLLGESRDFREHPDMRRELLKRAIQASIHDPSPSIPHEEVIEKLRERIARPRREPAEWRQLPPEQ